VDLTNIPHGVYILQARMKVTTHGNNNEFFFSNILTHKLMRKKDDNSNVLFAAYAPAECNAHMSELTYLRILSSENRNYTVRVFINGVEQKRLTMAANAPNLNTDYKLLFKKEGTYSLSFDLEELPSLKQEFTILVNKYDGDIPIINADSSALLLYLNPEGKTNSDINRNQWKSYDGGKIATLSSTMQYNENSGWLKDDKGISYLYLTSGNKLTLNGFDPFSKDLTIKGDNDISDSAGQGITIELDFEVDNVINFNSELIKCMSYTENK
jgi:hypothetical protein